MDGNDGVRVGYDRRASEPREPSGFEFEPVGDGPFPSAGEAVELLPQRDAVRGEADRRLGGRGGPVVGDEFGDGGVTLVPDRGDERHRTPVDRGGEVGVVEGPEILDRAAASCEQDRVNAEARGVFVEGIDGTHHGGRCSVALNGHIDENEFDRWAALLGGVEHIVKRRGTPGGEDRDASWERRNGAFGVGIEPSLGAEVIAEGAKAGFERAPAVFGDLVDDE